MAFVQSYECEFVLLRLGALGSRKKVTAIFTETTPIATQLSEIIQFLNFNFVPHIAPYLGKY